MKLMNQKNFEEQQKEQQKRIQTTMSRVSHKIAVISGKGGVGKSTVTVNLAAALVTQGLHGKVGILDADITGPCVPKILGLKGEHLQAGPIGIAPALSPYGIKAVSMAFLLPSDESPVIWRGPLKMKAIQQFLSDIVWGDLEFLLIDLPPGTGDEPMSIMQLLPEMDGVVIVTIPSEVSQEVVKKAVTFSRKLNIPIIGILENMSGFVCPKCGAEYDIFGSGGGQKIANDLGVSFLGKVPIDPQICMDSDRGTPFVLEHRNSKSTMAFLEIVDKIKEFLKNETLRAEVDGQSNGQSNKDKLFSTADEEE
jgi:ATP-binding protein involved in chromosome partitioning